MDPQIMQIIAQIQIIKSELYKRYKPQLIDVAAISSESINHNCENNAIRSKEYEKLMRQHRKLIYKNDIVAQKQAEATFEQLYDQRKKDEIKKKLSLRINLKPSTQEINNCLYELQKPWHKLSNNLKIQAILKFIETLAPSYHDDQINQLRYLLISSVSQKKINKITDVDYDSEKGMILRIPKLIYENNGFKLVEKDDLDNCVGINKQTPMLDQVISLPVEKKPTKKILTLKKK